MKYRKSAVLILALSLTGCGTVNTVIRSDDVVKKNMNEIETKCDSIPRVYSGVSYDFCYLHARPESTYHGIPSSSPPLIFVDILFSGVIDTVILPYSIYKQSQDGSIKVN